MKATSDQIQHLAITVENLTKVQQVPVPSSQSPGLRLPNLVLPEYTGKEPLDRFLEQIESLLVSSAVPTKHWIIYLKQQCQKDTRAYDALNSAHQTHLHLLGTDLSKTADAEFKQHFDQCVKTLREKRGKPRDQQIRDLLETYYTMQQNRHESVGDFAHRFCETQHELEKLIPKIHGELELIYAFVIKLREDISRDLISREFNYTTLQSLITEAQRYESHIGQHIGLEKLRSSRTDELSQWQPRPTQAHATMHTGTVEKPILGHSNSRSTHPSGGKVTGNSPFRGSSTALNKKGDPSSQ